MSERPDLLDRVFPPGQFQPVPVYEPPAPVPVVVRRSWLERALEWVVKA